MGPQNKKKSQALTLALSIGWHTICTNCAVHVQQMILCIISMQDCSWKVIRKSEYATFKTTLWHI